MEHGARLSTSRVMAIAFIFMSVLIVLSLSVNVIQGVNNYRLQNEQRTAVTPMGFNVPFAVSQNSADASYLQQMALSFIALRLNVSSETAATANWWTHCFPSKLKNCVPSCVIHRRPTWWKRKLRKRQFPSVLC